MGWTLAAAGSVDQRSFWELFPNHGRVIWWQGFRIWCVRVCTSRSCCLDIFEAPYKVLSCFSGVLGLELGLSTARASKLVLAKFPLFLLLISKFLSPRLVTAVGYALGPDFAYCPCFPELVGIGLPR